MRGIYLWSLMALPWIEAAISTNARCGYSYDASPSGMTCKGSKWGNCCSKFSYCGSTDAYCGKGCQSSFGTCSIAVTSSMSTGQSSSMPRSSTTSSPARSSTASVPVSTSKISTNARCGSAYNASPVGMTCLGSTYGNCCSRYSYCGSSSAYCGTGCQAGFGKCDAASSSSSSKASTASTLAQSASSPSSSAISSSASSSTSPTPLSSSVATTAMPTSSTPSATSSSSSSSITPSPSADPTTTSTELPSTSSACVVPAPTYTCVPYPECPTFNTPLTNGCPANSGMCNNNYFTRCEQVPAAGSVIIAQLGSLVAGGDSCRLACEARNDCISFVYSASNPASPPICDLYSSLNGFIASFANTYLRICKSTC